MMRKKTHVDRETLLALQRYCFDYEGRYDHTDSDNPPLGLDTVSVDSLIINGNRTLLRVELTDSNGISYGIYVSEYIVVFTKGEDDKHYILNHAVAILTPKNHQVIEECMELIQRLVNELAVYQL